MARHKKPSSFSRSERRFKPQPRVLVVCEDSKSSETYLINAAVHWRVKQHVTIEHCGKTDPLGIVQEAIKRHPQFEEVICVFDRDAHQNFDEALRIAGTHLPKCWVVLSYPCFEFWLLLHFDFTRRPYIAASADSAGDQVLRDLKQKNGMEGYAKGRIDELFGRLLKHLAAAKTNAGRVLEAADKESEPNPSTHMHRLMDRFQKLAEPQPIDSED